jgi:hypothetical protein
MTLVGLAVAQVIQEVTPRRDGTKGDECDDDVANDVVVTEIARRAWRDQDEDVFHPLARTHRREQRSSTAAHGS